MSTSIEKRCQQSADNFLQLIKLAPVIDQAAQIAKQAITQGNKIIFCGNGGSAADSQHLAAELIGRFLRKRDAMAAIALTTNSSILTAISNDYGYDYVFSRQLAGLGKTGDILICISTSGNSHNIIRVAEKAKEMKIPVIGLTGKDGGQLKSVSNILINVPATRTDLIQEMHIAVGHIFCSIIEGETNGKFTTN